MSGVVTYFLLLGGVAAFAFGLYFTFRSIKLI